jgi:hypothetical protein
MSKVKIQGNASGTGVVTLTAPNTNIDRTITLPDGDISLGVGIDDNATSTAITIDASENVGIGTASPEKLLDVTGNFAGEIGLVRINNDSTSTSPVATSAIEFGGVGALKASIAAQVYGGGDMMFRNNNNTEKLRILANGGITFNGDTAAANALDDYETGTFTPSLRFDIGGTGIVYGTRTGTYTKIGNLVHLNYRITVTSGVSASDYFCRLEIPWSIVQGAGDQVTRAKQYNSSLSDWALSSQNTATAPVFYASNSINDYAKGDDVNGRTISGSYTFIAQ